MIETFRNEEVFIEKGKVRLKKLKKNKNFPELGVEKQLIFWNEVSTIFWVKIDKKEKTFIV